MDVLFDEAQAALRSLHDNVKAGDAGYGASASTPTEASGAPLAAVLDALTDAMLSPAPTAPPLAGLRAALAALLFSSHSPPDLAKWLADTDMIEGKEVNAARVQVRVRSVHSLSSLSSLSAPRRTL